MPIPAFVNPRSGSAAAARTAIGGDARFELRETDPAALADAVRGEVERGTPRILVSGGDGSVAQACGAAAGSALEIAVFPGGTLNHFAHDVNIPCDDPAAALELAAAGAARAVDLGYVNEQAILNTSSVGLYVLFVRARERLEPWLGYRIASVFAAVRTWVGLRGFTVAFETADGVARSYRAPLVFVGVGERALERSETGLGNRVPNGRRALHVFVVRADTPAAMLRLALGSLLRGVRTLTRTEALDVYLVDACTITLRRPWGTVSVDGELVRMRAPLAYRLQRDAVHVVTGSVTT